MDELELLARIVKGDEAAFREFVNRFERRVHNTALSMLQNKEDAEDVAQEVFVEVFRSASRFKGESKVSTWLYRITVNRSLDLIRSRKRQKRFGFVRSIFGENSVEPQLDKGHFEHPGVIMENSERAQILFSALEKLAARQKAAFVLQKIEGLSQKETALALGISESAVESLLSRATQTLRKLLGEYYDEDRRNS